MGVCQCDQRGRGSSVIALDGLAEPLGNDPRGAELVEIRDQEAELVAGDAVDDLVAERMPERVVEGLEGRDIDEPDGAPAAALLERQEGFELLTVASRAVSSSRIRFSRSVKPAETA